MAFLLHFRIFGKKPVKKIELQTEIIGFSFVFLKFFIKEVPRKKLDCTIRIIKLQWGFGNLINKKREILIRTMAKRY